MKGSVGEEGASCSRCILWEKLVLGVECQRAFVVESAVSRR